MSTKVILTVLGITAALSIVTSSASAKTVIIKKDHPHHYMHHDHDKTIIIKR